MKMKALITGIKRSKGIMRETGIAYDSTTVFVNFPFAQSDDMRGASTQPMRYGTSDNYSKFDGLSFPFDAEIDLDVETNGKSVNTVIVDVLPLLPKKVDTIK